ncbi:MAG: hypothetical protein OIF57_17565 [Marinobacterium sp.]|nr:hypothetical protein [Marinobacterium sp.]
MKYKVVLCFTALALYTGPAYAISACEVACDTAEAAGEVACVLEIFAEPECGIAVRAAGIACRAACEASDTSQQESVEPKPTGLCDGQLKPENKALAAQFCKAYK